MGPYGVRGGIRRRVVVVAEPMGATGRVIGSFWLIPMKLCKFFKGFITMNNTI